MLNEVKHLANVSCQVLARDSSDATLCQNDTQRGEKEFMDNIYIIALILVQVERKNKFQRVK